MSIVRFVVRLGLWAVAIFMVMTLILVIVARPVMHYWGTTENERGMTIPGDSLLEHPPFTYTQAITINAPKEIVWAYLIQVGYQRAGWYNIDWINGMIKDYFYEDGQSADRIIPELQNLEVGDMIYITPDGGFRIIELEKDELLLMVAEVEEEDGSTGIISTWTYTLDAEDENTTRLITRFKTVYPDEIGFKILMVVINEVGGATLQQPAMLRSLKQRAETEYQRNTAKKI